MLYCIITMENLRLQQIALYYFQMRLFVASICIFLCNIVVLEAGFKGAGLKHTNKNYINSIELPNVPSLEEQDKVIEVLDKIQAVVSGRITELSKLDELIKARFVCLYYTMLINHIQHDALQLICLAIPSGKPLRSTLIGDHNVFSWDSLLMKSMLFEQAIPH